MIAVTKIQDIPDEDHYAVFTNRTIYIPADERSRYHPGHGYPASNEPVVSYIAFTDIDELREWMRRHKHDHFKAVFVKKVTVSTTIKIDIQH